MSLLDTAMRMADYQPHEFIAPIPISGKVDIHIFQNGVPLHYKVQGNKPDWYSFYPIDQSRCELMPWAFPKDIVHYLIELPRFYAIACIPSGEHEWLVVPYNASDAAQRGWKDGQPRKLYLAKEKLSFFDVIVTRQLGDILLFDSLDYRLGSQTKTALYGDILDNNKALPNYRDWNNAYNIIFEWQEKVIAEMKTKELQDQLASTQSKMEFLLEFMGAKMVSSEKKGNGYEVIWCSPDGHTYRMAVKEDGHINVAGLCLDGTDSIHNLSSIVQVMEEAQRRHRPDIHEAYEEIEDVEWDD